MNHHHHHHHHPPKEDLSASSQVREEPLDPGMKELADALQKMFFILKVVIALVIGWLIWSGVYRVEENEQAIELRFGRVKGVGQQAILKPGLHWAWPKPIEEVVKIPASNVVRQLPVNAFWYYQDEKEKAGVRVRPPGQTLQFVRDGYSLTASKGVAQVMSSQQSRSPTEGSIEVPMTDYNLVHTRWNIRYRVEDPRNFVENLWAGRGSQSGTFGWFTVENCLRNALCEAVIITSAEWDIDMIVWKEPDTFKNEVEQRFIQKIKHLKIGVDAKLELVEQIPPRQVKPFFDQAASAGIEAEKIIKMGQAKASTTLFEATSQATKIIAQAKAYQTTIVEAAKADAQYLSKVMQKIDDQVNTSIPAGTGSDQQRDDMRQALLAQTIDQLYHEALRDVIDNADEVFVLNAPENADVEWRPLINRDASLGKKRKSQSNQKATP